MAMSSEAILLAHPTSDKWADEGVGR